MGIFNNIFKRDEQSATAPTSSTPTPTPTPQTEPEVDDVLLNALMRGDPVTRQQAMTIPAVSAAVDFISGAIASMPVKLYWVKEDDNGKPYVESRDDDLRVRRLNNDTGDTLDAYQMKKAMVEDYLMGRGGYAYIQRGERSNDVAGLYYVQDEYVSVLWNADPIFKKRKLFVFEKEYELFDFIKLLRNSKDGAEGIGLTTEVATALDTAYSTLVYQLSAAKSGGNKKGFLKASKKLGQDEINVLKAAWRNLYANKGESVVVLNNGLEFQEASNSATEMQLDQNKRTLTDEINAIFHIYPADYYRTFKEAIYPIVKAFETALNHDLLLESEKGKKFFELDVKEILRVNIKERYEAYKLAKETGFLTINEIRRAENLGRIEGMDVVNVGLSAVLYDTNTHKYYTPNTDAVHDMEGIQKEIIDHDVISEQEQEGNIRFNPNHDAKGKFASGHGGSGGGSSSGSGGNGDGKTGGADGGNGTSGSSDKETAAKVKAETEKVKSRLSNDAKPIKKEAVNIKDVKDRGGLNDADAKKCADIADKIYEKAAAKEPQITADVISSAEAAGGKMYGLDFRLKQPTSMAGKIGSDAKEYGSFDKAGDNIKDSIRYTAVIDDKNFTNGYNSIKKSMEDKGYTEVRCKNFYEMYNNGTSCQKAVQSVYKNKDGQYFEFQFHTPTSQGAKELNHPLYEEQRKETTTPKRWKELNDQMTSIGANVPNPPDVLSIKSHK